jgi:hypothetical protein
MVASFTRDRLSLKVMGHVRLGFAAGCEAAKPKPQYA